MRTTRVYRRGTHVGLPADHRHARIFPPTIGLQMHQRTFLTTETVRGRWWDKAVLAQGCVCQLPIAPPRQWFFTCVCVCVCVCVCACVRACVWRGRTILKRETRMGPGPLWSPGASPKSVQRTVRAPPCPAPVGVAAGGLAWIRTSLYVCVCVCVCVAGLPSRLSKCARWCFWVYAVV